LLPPPGIVFDGIAVNGFVFAAVNAEIGLAVAIEIELAESEAAGDWLLEDAGGDDGVVPRNFAREADVEGDELHGPETIRCASGREDTERAFERQKEGSPQKAKAEGKALRERKESVGRLKGWRV
jgi:hypothetical protein